MQKNSYQSTGLAILHSAPSGASRGAARLLLSAWPQAQRTCAGARPPSNPWPADVKGLAMLGRQKGAVRGAAATKPSAIGHWPLARHRLGRIELNPSISTCWACMLNMPPGHLHLAFAPAVTHGLQIKCKQSMRVFKRRFRPTSCMLWSVPCVAAQHSRGACSC